MFRLLLQALSRAVDGDLGDDLVAVGAEHHAPLQDRGRVVEVHDDVGAPWQAWKVRSISSSRHWVSTWMVTSSGNGALLDDLADEVEIGLAGRREADLDLAL